MPLVLWDASASFAAADGMSTTGGQNLIRDALVIRHRLPRLWRRVTAGEVQVWRARRVAQTVLGAPADVVAYVDEHVTPVAERCGVVVLDRILEEALQRLHAEEREQRARDELAARFVRLEDAALRPCGVSDLHVRGEWKDVHDFDAAVAAVAEALRRDGCEETLDVRRAIAVGVLAEPARAQALLEGSPAPAPTRSVVLYLHLSEAGLHGLDPVARCETTGRAVLEQEVRDWCGRTDAHLTVRPVLDLADHIQVEAYEIPDRLREQVTLLHPTCVFPWCARPARSCDLDHVVPHGSGGTTSSDNLAPLCRRHHRLKTHTAWTYRPLDPLIDPGVFIWTDPHGLQYLRGPTGTAPIPAPD